jgi:hypothetical protein
VISRRQWVKTDEQLVEMHRERQELLSRGLTPQALRLSADLSMALTISWQLAATDTEQLAIAFDVLHQAAFTDPAARPPRLVPSTNDQRPTDKYGDVLPRHEWPL